MTRIDADYLVVGAGATGLAFTDALVDHRPDVRVVLVDRRPGPGGHWRQAYPFVRLHQSSTFYGVASTLLGGGRIQVEGPEAGLHERADQPTILRYYDDVLARLVGTGRVELISGSEYDASARAVVSVVSGERREVSERSRIVDGRYLAPDIPAETAPRFGADGARVIPVNDLPRVEDPPGQYVVVGSGKTATDAIVWLLGRGTDPDAICWVRPREPWMLNRAKIQPDPEIFLGMVADLMGLARSAESLDGFFLALEDAGIMLRIDPSLVPTMAKSPTLGEWELELLRGIGNVVRLGHVVAARRGRLDLAEGSVGIAEDAVVVNCAADGLKQPPLVPIWRPEAITVQPVRAGFPCFGAALVGYVEATRGPDDFADADADAEKNRLCPPSNYGNTLADWVSMNVRGFRASASFGAEPDIKAFADRTALNPSRVPRGHPGSPVLDDALARLQRDVGPGVGRLAELSGLT